MKQHIFFGRAVNCYKTMLRKKEVGMSVVGELLRKYDAVFDRFIRVKRIREKYY